MKNDKPTQLIAQSLRREGFDVDEVFSSPGSTLAALLDLHGSVGLAEFLEDIIRHPHDGLSIPLHPIDPAIAMARAEEETERILAKYLGAFDDAFRAYYRLPTGSRAVHLLNSSGLLEAFSAHGRAQGATIGKAKRTLVRTLWSPYDEFVQTQLKRARFSAVELRSEVAILLAQVSIFAGQLARVDAALHQATKNAVDTLVNRLGPPMEQRFSDGLDVFDNEGAPASDEANGLNLEGLLREVFFSYGRLARGVLEHELRQICQLVHAATYSPPA